MKNSVIRSCTLGLLAGAVCLLLGCSFKEIWTAEVTAGPELTASPTSTPTLSPTPVPTSTPKPTAIPTLPPIPEPTPCGLLSWRESKRFTEEGVEQGDNYYRSSNISITIETISDKKSKYSNRKLAGYVADIYIKDITSFRHGYAKKAFTAGGYKSIENLSQLYDAVLALSGDFCDEGKNCLVIWNGELIFRSQKFTRDLCVLYKDGTIEVYAPNEIDVEAIMEKEPWQSWSFGPILLDKKGRAAKTFNLPDSIAGRNPRAVLGYYEPGHYCFVCIDGRKSDYSAGLSIKELAQFMEDLGCTAAYNLDGGITAQIAFMGERLNHPKRDRSLRDILYIVDSIEALSTEDTVEGAAE